MNAPDSTTAAKSLTELLRAELDTESRRLARSGRHGIGHGKVDPDHLAFAVVTSLAGLPEASREGGDRPIARCGGRDRPSAPQRSDVRALHLLRQKFLAAVFRHW